MKPSLLALLAVLALVTMMCGLPTSSPTQAVLVVTSTPEEQAVVDVTATAVPPAATRAIVVPPAGEAATGQPDEPSAEGNPAGSFGAPANWTGGPVGCDQGCNFADVTGATIACYFVDVTGDGRADSVSHDNTGIFVLAAQ